MGAHKYRKRIKLNQNTKHNHQIEPTIQKIARHQVTNSFVNNSILPYSAPPIVALSTKHILEWNQRKKIHQKIMII